ncbi:MAG: flagellar biosynthetic protein FliO [Rhodospirillales bacterium]|nr:flagellar biosynthetic protein FliO [Rhodospirillales bacterium]
MTAATPLVALAALAGVVALLLLLRRLLALLPLPLAPPRTGVLALEQVLALDARRRIVLVRCGTRRLLLLTGGPQDVSLGWLEPPA